MKKTRTIIIIICVAVVILALVIGLGTEKCSKNRNQEMIATVQNTTIGNGVTLQQGIRAYFGVRGDWFVVNDEVHVLAYGDEHSFEATFSVGKNSVDIITCSYDFYPPTGEELDQLLADMARAAK